MGSQVTCVLEIPEPCYIDSTPFFLDGPMSLRVYTLKVLLSIIFWMVLNRKNPLFAGSGFSSSTIPGDSSALQSWNLDPKWLYHPERFQKQGRNVYIEYVCLVGWGRGRTVFVGGVEKLKRVEWNVFCFFGWWLQLVLVGGFNPLEKNMSPSLKPPKDKGHEPRKPWH